MTQLGHCDNVIVKLSGGFSTDPHWTHQSAMQVVKDTVQCFGSKKCAILSYFCIPLKCLCRSMFASDFPVDKINGTFSEWMKVVTDSISCFTSEEQQMIMAGNATKIYRL